MVKWLVDHSTTVLLAVLVLFVFGSLSYVTLPREASPDITIPVVMVTTPYVGVSPEDIEGLVTIPLERELAGLSDLKKLSSTSAEGVSVVSIEFEADVVIEDALQKVRDRVNRAKANLPSDVEEPSVREIAFSDVPIGIVTIAGPVDEETLKELGERLQDEAARIPGVLDARLAGGLERQVRVQVDPDRLAHYGLSMNDVVGAIRDENVNIPGGNVTVNDGSYLLRVPSEFAEAHEVEDVAIKRVGDRPVFVRDIGRVVWGYKDRTEYARMNGQSAVSLSVTKRPGQNIIEIVDALRIIVEAESKDWPEGVSYKILSDQSQAIRNMVSDLQNGILTALLLVLGVLLVSMGLRASTFVALAVPLSMLISVLALDALGFTLNMIVLFSLILAVGMLVDNAIVVVENVYRHLEMGKTPYQASIDGTNEVAIAVAASTATTVAAFFPLVFWGGIMGEFMGFLPKTVIIVLIASLLVAIFVLPVLTAKTLPASGGHHLDETPDPNEVPANLLMRAYKGVLEWSIRWRYVSAILGVGTLITTFVIYGALNHGTQFFPDADPNRATIGVRLADGTDLEATDRVARRIEQILATEANVDVWVAESGVAGGGNNLMGAQGAPNQARITVDFLKDAINAGPGDRLRVESTQLTIDRLRDRLAEIPGAEISVEKEAMGPPVGKPIGLLVTGDDFHEVGAFSQRLRRDIRANVPGVTELKDDYRVGRPELRLRVDRGAAKRAGVSSSLVGNTVRTAVAGTKASALRDGEDEYDIIVEVDPAERRDLQKVLNLRVPGRTDTSPDTFPVPMSAVASYELAGGSGSIRHEDQDLVITLEGDVLEGYNANDVKAAVWAYVETYPRPAGIRVDPGSNDKEQQESMAFLGRAFGIAVALILLVLVTQFDSLAIPMIVLATVVLSLIGVLWGLLLTGTPFDIIMTGIGVISLAGVVVNNAIVLLDYVQQLLARGLDVRGALVVAGLHRFRPVMLTAVTTVLGLVPMALGISIDFFNFRVLSGGSSSQFWGPMAVAVIFGLAFATVLTLVMVPTLYGIYDDWNRFVRYLGGLIRRPSQQTPPNTEPSGSPAAAKIWPALLLLPLLGGSPAQAVTLDEAIQAAEAHHLGLAMAVEQTRQTELLRAQAWSTVQPRVSTNATYVFNQREVALDMSEAFAPLAEQFGIELPPQEPTLIQAKRFAQAQFVVDQTLFSATALPLLRGAEASIAAAELDEANQRRQIRAGVARAFMSLHAAREGVKLAESARALAASQLVLAERSRAAEIATEREQLQAQVGLSRAERDVVAAQERLVQAEEAFRRLTGLPPGTPIELDSAPLPLPSDLDAALADAIERRPDLQAAAKRTEIAQLQHKVAHLGWVPRVDGRYNWTWSENTGFNGFKSNWTATVTASWTLWDGGGRVIDAKRTASQVRLSELAAADAEERALEEVRTAWVRYERAEASLRAVERERAWVQESLRLSERGFEAESATWLDVEQARLAVASTELSAVSERIARDSAAIDLLVAMGRF